VLGGGIQSNADLHLEYDQHKGRVTDAASNAGTPAHIWIGAGFRLDTGLV
jgi:hypothetical protein